MIYIMIDKIIEKNPYLDYLVILLKQKKIPF